MSTTKTKGARGRAIERRRQLRTSRNGALELLADIYHDEDWRLIEETESGEPYTSFVKFACGEAQMSPSYARRAQQTIRELVLPIREHVGPEAAVNITMYDMQRLGTTGARALVAGLQADPPTGRRRADVIHERIEAAVAGGTAPTAAPLEEETANLPSAPGRTAAAVPAAAAQPTARDEGEDLPWATGPTPPPPPPSSVPAQPAPLSETPATAPAQAATTAAATPVETTAPPPAAAESSRDDTAHRPATVHDALEMLLGVAAADVAAEFTGKEQLLARAAVQLTQIRARVLAAGSAG